MVQKEYESELSRIDALIDEMMQIAEKDGKISDDEQTILDAIFSELGEYRNLVLDILEDGKISEAEREKMHQFKERILNEISKLAIQDGNYTSEEKALIESLIVFSDIKRKSES